MTEDTNRAALFAALDRNLATGRRDREAAASAWMAEHHAGPLPHRIADAMAEGLSLADAFARGATAAGAKVSRAADVAAAVALVRDDLAATGETGPLVRADDPALAGFDALADYAPHIGAARSDDRIGVSRAAAAVAETGTLVMVSEPTAPTGVNFLPEVHVVFLFASTIRAAYEEVWGELRRRNRWPRTVNLITGPSRTGDIELTLQIGVHGPRKVHVVVIDDDRV